MELFCSIALYLVLTPLGTQSQITQSYREGMCDTFMTTARVHEHGILQIENEFLVYQIPLPINIDATWLTYRLGDEYAYLGDCAPAFHPFEDEFCRKVMTRIALVGFM